MKKNTSGFTIVELLIVIVVIAILAAVSVVAYSGMASRARDAQRKADAQQIVKALEMYYIDNGEYPEILQTGAGIAPGVANSHPAYMNTWNELASKLSPYVSTISRDPINGDRNGLRYVYSYTPMRSNSDWPLLCEASKPRQAFYLTYRRENAPQENTAVGICQNGGRTINIDHSNYVVMH